MAKKEDKNKESIGIEIIAANEVSYCDIIRNNEPIKRLYIKNYCFDEKKISIKITSEPQFIIPVEITDQVLPGFSTISQENTCVLSPLFFAELSEAIEGKLFVEVSEDKKILRREEIAVTLLGYGECRRPENMACFVKRSQLVNAVLSAADKNLKEWKQEDIYGYGGGKNGARFIAAALYRAIAGLKFELLPSERTLVFRNHKEIVKSKSIFQHELAAVFAAAAEAKGLNPVIAKVGEKWYVGAYLGSDCADECVIDEGTYIEKRISKEVSEMTLVSIVEALKGMGFEGNENKTRLSLQKYPLEFCVDIRRCRINGFSPLPERILVGGRYNLVEDKEYDTVSPPTPIEELKGNFAGDKLITRQKQWERRLLELDMRNPLLNFRTTSAVKLITARMGDFVQKIADEEEIVPLSDDRAADEFSSEFEKASSLKQLGDFILYEYRAHRLMTTLKNKDFDRTLSTVYRKEKRRQEETGCSTLQLAAGFLRYNHNGEKNYYYAPLLLYPVILSRKGAVSHKYFVTVSKEEAHVNNTLLEYLYHQFNIDLRGLGEMKCTPENLEAAVARIRKETLDKKGWEIYDSVYLGTLSFSNFQMWLDVRGRADVFKESKVISSLIENRSLFSGSDYLGEIESVDSAAAEGVYLPISADSSQYTAIKDSLDKSFVLHGPPGTGKSQTITNIIVNNIVRGKRVLFVAEKAAALEVVNKRLRAIGVGDFCLELYSDKIKKTEVAAKLVNTLALAHKEEPPHSSLPEQLDGAIAQLSGEMDELHKKRALGCSVYEGIMGYLRNSDAPDFLKVDKTFYEQLNEETFLHLRGLLLELTARAEECKGVKSAFSRVGNVVYSPKWQTRGINALEIYDTEIKHLSQYARTMFSVFGIRSATLSRRKLKSLYEVCVAIKEGKAKHFLKKNARPSELRKFVSCKRELDSLKEAFALKYGKLPQLNISEILGAGERQQSRIAKKYAMQIRLELDKDSRTAFFDDMAEICRQSNIYAELLVKTGAIVKATVEKEITDKVNNILKILDKAGDLYADAEEDMFLGCLRYIEENTPFQPLDYYIAAYENTVRAKTEYAHAFNITDEDGDDMQTTVSEIAALRKNLGGMAGWCRYQEIVEKCRENGLEFVIEPLKGDRLAPDEVLASFDKCVYYHFALSEIALSDKLCHFSGLTLEETMDKINTLTDDYERLTRKEIYSKLVDALPRPEEEGPHNVEKVVLLRAEKNGMKGLTIRKLFEQIPNLFKRICPCIVTSPTGATQFLNIDLEKFDLVVFDEASQVPTCKAVGTIARAKRVIVVGDPQQLPPTSFFGADFKEDEQVDSLDLDSILDDCLSIGMPERHLLWHYRSHHESLIAFSNAMYYDNNLYTFPSPAELESKVSLKQVDGIYERGGKKINRLEGTELVKEVISRLKNPSLRGQSIGIVTFSLAQQNYVDDLLSEELRKENLEREAFEREEPIFVKNLENVQGDERDVILFSVGYGPDDSGKVSLNFGPLNQANGYRRLNVAVTRARMEMVVFSSLRANMIDLSRTDARGVKGLKAFLEYAERGREMLAVNAKDISSRKDSIGSQIAKRLRDRGVMCVSDLGVSDFRIDVAIVDNRGGQRYILAVMCDSDNINRVKAVRDRVAMQNKILKTLGWNVYNLWTLNYFANPAKELQKIKDVVNKLMQNKTPKKASRAVMSKYIRAYRMAPLKPLTGGSDYVLAPISEDSVCRRIDRIIEIEQPIEMSELASRMQYVFGITPSSKRANERLMQLACKLATRKETGGKTYFMREERLQFRPFTEGVKRDFNKVYPLEIIAALRCTLESHGALSLDELIKETLSLFNVKRTRLTAAKVEDAIKIASNENYLVMTVDGKFTV